MNGELPLPSFEVEGFRAIRHVRLPALGRVTLVVGPNNAGKTSLLDAIRLFLSTNPKALLHHIIFHRSNLDLRFGRDIRPEELQEEASRAIQNVRSLFYGYFEGDEQDRIRLGQAGLSAATLTVNPAWYGLDVDEQASALRERETEVLLAPDMPIIEVERDGIQSTLDLTSLLNGFRVMLSEGSRRVSYIPANGFEESNLVGMWTAAAAGGNADRVETVLQSVMPELELERVHLLGAGAGERLSLAFQVRGKTHPVPFRAMGDGVGRVVGIALALSRVQSPGGVILIDEVESGLHFSVQDQVWEAIFNLALQLNVQVIATTHSWDTIVGFQNAANRSPAEGMLYRLEREANGEIYAERYTETEVAIAAEQRIEVR